MLVERKKKIFEVLKNIKKRYNAIFFSKLILSGEEKQYFDQRIRHYDIECQAATNMVDILQTKIKTIEFKSFYQIKDYSHRTNYPSTSRLGISHARSNGTLPKSTFSRSNRNAMSSTNFVASPGRFRGREHQPKPAAPTRKQNMKYQFSELDCSMFELMSKVKNLSQQFNRKNQPYCYHQSEDDDCFSEKLQKRKLIMSKLNKLQNDLSTFLEEENSGKFQTTSNVEYRVRPVQQLYNNNNNNYGNGVFNTNHVGSNFNKNGKFHTNTTYFSRDEIYSRKW